jgi:glyoxylase-like metal-dependent hydrolase (beta-lactamase superfamily II)
MMPTVETIIQGFGVRTDQGSLGFCSVTLVRASRNILVDAAQVGHRQILVQKLAEKGLKPDDIDIVFLTHGHWDHVLNVDVFPHATFLIHPLERAYIRNPHQHDWATPVYTSAVLESYRLQEVKEGEEIDDGVRVIDSPGHSRGSMSLLVNTAAGVAAITGDALVSTWSVRTGLPRLIFWDEPQAKDSIRKLLDQAQLFYPGPTTGRSGWRGVG